MLFLTKFSSKLKKLMLSLRQEFTGALHCDVYYVCNVFLLGWAFTTVAHKSKVDV